MKYRCIGNIYKEENEKWCGPLETADKAKSLELSGTRFSRVRKLMMNAGRKTNIPTFLYSFKSLLDFSKGLNPITT